MKQLGQQPPQTRVNVDLSQATDIRCENCGGRIFLPAAAFKKISRLAVGAQQDVLIPVDLFACANCGRVLEELLPEQLKGEYVNNEQ